MANWHRCIHNHEWTISGLHTSPAQTPATQLQVSIRPASGDVRNDFQLWAKRMTLVFAMIRNYKFVAICIYLERLKTTSYPLQAYVREDF